MDKNNRKRSPGLFLEQFEDIHRRFAGMLRDKEENENETKKDAGLYCFPQCRCCGDGSAGKSRRTFKINIKIGDYIPLVTYNNESVLVALR